MSSVYEDPSSWRLRTSGVKRVPYRIISTEGDIEAEAASAQMKILIPADRLLDFAHEMFPPVYMSGGFPRYPARGRIGGTPLQAFRIHWKGHIDGKPVDPLGIDRNPPEGTYQDVCEVTVRFQTLDANQDEPDPNNPETFLDISCSGAGEFIHTTAPDGEWTEEEGGEETPGDGEPNELMSTAVSIMVPETEWNVSWPRVPVQHWVGALKSKLRAALGKVNSRNMPIFFDAPPETILFLGYSMSRQYTWREQQPPFKLDLKFLEKHVSGDGGVYGHNHFWKADEGWMRLLINEKPVYASGDLMDLFRP